MSPEQSAGLAVDPRTDIFFLGIVLFELLAGKRPFDRAGMADYLASLRSAEPPSLGRFRDDAPLDLERIIRKALAKRPDDRYSTASALLHDLRSLRDRLARPALHLARPAIPPAPHPAAGVRRHFTPRPILAIAAGFLILAVVSRFMFRPPGAMRLTELSLLTAAGVLLAFYFLFRRRRTTSPAKIQPPVVAFRGLLPYPSTAPGCTIFAISKPDRRRLSSNSVPRPRRGCGRLRVRFRRRSTRFRLHHGEDYEA